MDEKVNKNKLFSNVFRRMSHDLRTPLASIISSLSLIHQKGADLPFEITKKLIDQSLKESQKLDRYLMNIIFFSKIESESLSVNIADFSVQEILDALQASVEAHYGCEINIQYDCQCPQEKVKIDLELFKHVLMNLIDNAHLYAQSSEPCTVSASVNTLGNVVIEVKDCGKPIAQEDRKRVFEKFVRLEDHQNKGLGLGLYLCKELCTLMNIDIQCPSGDKNVFQLVLKKSF